MHSKWSFFSWFIAFVALAAIGAGIYFYMPHGPVSALSARPAPPPPAVTVALPIRKTIDIMGEWVGQLDSPQTVELRAREMGYIKEIKFKDGDEIEKGALLFVIDPAPYEVALQKAQAQLQTSNAALRQAKDTKQIEVGKAKLNSSKVAYANAQKTAKDNVGLLPSGAVSREAADKSVTLEKQAEATVAADEATLAQAESDYLHNIAKAEANVAVDTAAVSDAELSLSYTKVYAPIAGRIGRSEVKIGALVGKSESTLLATMSQIDPVWVYFAVGEREAFELHKLREEKKLGKGHDGEPPPLQIVLENREVYPYDGKINFLARTIDSGTGTLTFRAEFPNPGKYLRPGHYAKVRGVITERPNAILVSERAIGTDQSGKYVLLVSAESKVEYRQVVVGARSDGSIVIEKGLNGDERVIVNGLQRARPGSIVKPVLEPAMPEPKAVQELKAVPEPKASPESQSSAALTKSIDASNK